MLVSKKWLHDFVFLPDSLSSDELASNLTEHTVEVDGVRDIARELDNVVVGKIISVEKHPNADSLQVCMVENGEKSAQIICGGSNVREGMLVALAKLGACVRWHGEGDLVELKAVKIRGLESEGMICASDEIGLLELFPKLGEKEILDLTEVVPKAKSGTPLVEALELGDAVLDIDNKSMTHRPDLWGHYGIARELSALYRKELSEYKPPNIKEGDDYNIKVSIEAPDLCKRYMAVVVNGVEAKPSPLWLRRRLASVGVRPKNIIVDITNYIMFDLGQPMHAFDVDKLSASKQDGKKNISILVRTAKKDESCVALDDKEHKLSDEMLVIAQKFPIAIAGVIGCNDSSVSETTSTVLLEAANFEALSVRRTATSLGSRTDASTRFEKSLDPELPALALKRAVQLFQELCPEATVVSNVADEYQKLSKIKPIELSLDYLEKKIGMALPKKDVVDILVRLGFLVKEKAKSLSVVVPSWRATKDISQEEDLIEEVARIYGYNNIPVSLPSFAITPAPIDPLLQTIENIKSSLAYEAGCTEVQNYSFVAPEWLATLGVGHDDHLELDNPVAKDRPLLRKSLLPDLILSVDKNNKFTSEVRLFEVGRTYNEGESGERTEPNSGELLPRQDTMLAVVYAAKGDETPFFELRSVLDQLGEHLGIAPHMVIDDISEMYPYAHPSRSAKIFVSGQDVGVIFELHPMKAREIGIDERLALIELNVSAVTLLRKDIDAYTPLSIYPAAVRDIAVVVSKEVLHRNLVTLMHQISPLLVDIELFDVYEGEHVAVGSKSMAYHLTYQSNDKTLESKEVDKLHAKVLAALKKEFKAEIRK